MIRNSGATPLTLQLVPGAGSSEAGHSFSNTPTTLSVEAGQSVTFTAGFQASFAAPPRRDR